MTNQTNSQKCLGGSPAGISFSRLCTLTLAAILATGGAATGFGQDQPAAAKPAKPLSEKKKAKEPTEKISHGYLVHQSIEVGGRITSVSGSQAMWNTLVNQGSGGRILSQSLEMHSVDTSKTPFFDTFTTNSLGYGGDPINVSHLNISKGRAYDFAGSFRRDRQYFDYNLLANSLLGPNALIPEPDSLHIYNTVRRNTDAVLTILPLSRVSIRAGINHGTHEGPSLSSFHGGGDVILAQWFRNSSDTYSGGVDVKLAKRTTISYDQFYVFYKGDTSFQLTGAIFKLSNGTPVSLGVNTLKTATCGAGANKTLSVVNGVANPYCSATIVMNETAPTRTTFPTEQFRFSSHYWDRVSMNGRILYSGATGSVNNFNETFNGFSSRTFLRQVVETGALSNGQLSKVKRVNVNGDFGIVADFNRYFSVSEGFNYWNYRIPGNISYLSTSYIGTASTSILTPISSLTPTTATTTDSTSLNQKISQNTVLATATLAPQVKISGGWRFKTREIARDGEFQTWHENWALLGMVVQPAPILRFNLNYDHMNSKSATPETLSNTYTRLLPDKIDHIRARATIRAAKWINFGLAINDFSGKNDDPLVNHTEHNRDFSFATSIIPSEQFSVDLSYAHDLVNSHTDLCFISTPLPTGFSNAGTCVPSESNPTATANLLLGTGNYNAPVNFFSGGINFAPVRYIRINGGVRLNDMNGTAEQLNPLMVPGALQSKFLTPFADVLLNISPQWAWHGNWMHNGYSEQGPVGPTASRDTHGDTVTLGVKYAF